MEVGYAFFCHSAYIDPSGNVSVLGIFNEINAQSVPVVMPRLAFVVCLKAHRTELGAHKVRLNMVDVDGRSLLGNQVEIEAFFSAERPHFNAIADFGNVQFPSTGDYSMDIVVDQRHERSEVLKVTPAIRH